MNDLGCALIGYVHVPRFSWIQTLDQDHSSTTINYYYYYYYSYNSLDSYEVIVSHGHENILWIIKKPNVYE